MIIFILILLLSRYIDQFLDEFCQNEGFTSKEIYNKVQRAVTEYP